MLKNWQQTNAAVEKLADFYMYWARIIDPQSDLYDPEKPQNATNIEHILPEISASYRDECAIDFRKVIKDIGEAVKIKPKTEAIGPSLRLNLSAVGRQKPSPQTVLPEALIAEFGTRLEKVLLERIGTMTAGREKLQAALVKDARERGIMTTAQPAATGQAAVPDTIAKLLNQDMYAASGGIKNVVALRDLLIEHKRKASPDLQGAPADDIVSMDQALAACEELSRLSPRSRSANPRTGELVCLGDGVKGTFNKVSARDGFTGRQPIQRPNTDQLVRSTDFIESLKIPALAAINMSGIWRNTISAERLIPSSAEATPLIQMAEGSHASRIGITSLMAQDENGKAVPIHVIIDGERKKSLIVTNKVDDKTKVALGNEYTIVCYGDANAENQVQSFIADTLRHPSRRGMAAQLEQQLTFAFILRAGNESDMQPLARLMTNKNTPVDAPVYILNQPA